MNGLRCLAMSNRSHLEDKEMPHVLLVVDQLPETLGGGERVVLKIASELPKYGFRVSILTFFIHPNSTAVRKAPCPIYLLPMDRALDLHTLRAAFELRQFIVQHDVRIVQTFFESSDLWAGFVAKVLTRAKVIWSRRDMGILRTRKHNIAYRCMACVPDVVFAVSEQVRRHCIDSDGMEASRVETIYNGLNAEDWFLKRTRNHDHLTPLITAVGNIRRVKGHDIFIQAAAEISARFPDARYCIVGDVLEPAYFEELTLLVERLGLGERFSIQSQVCNLREHLAEADIFVLPSRSEGFSNAIIEAMATSLPAVATRVGGNAEAIVDGVTGILVPTEDPSALARAVMKLISDPDLGRAMGAAGREAVVMKFSTGMMMKNITATYERLIGCNVL